MMYKQDVVLKVLNRFSPSSWKTQWLRHQYCNNLPDTVHSTCPGTFRTVQLGVFVYQFLGFCAFSFEQRFLNPPYSSPTFKTRFLVAWAHPKREVWTSKPHLTHEQNWTKQMILAFSLACTHWYPLVFRGSTPMKTIFWSAICRLLRGERERDLAIVAVAGPMKFRP